MSSQLVIADLLLPNDPSVSMAGVTSNTPNDAFYLQPDLFYLSGGALVYPAFEVTRVPIISSYLRAKYPILEVMDIHEVEDFWRRKLEEATRRYFADPNAERRGGAVLGIGIRGPRVILPGQCRNVQLHLAREPRAAPLQEISSICKEINPWRKESI